MINHRILQIVSILLTSEKGETILTIAEEIGMSSRTVRNMFPQIGVFLELNNLKLVKKPGVGISIWGKETAKLKLLSEINETKAEGSFTSKSRQLTIIGMFLIDELSNVTVGMLEEILFVSPPSLYKDLKEIGKWFEERDIELKRDRNKGIYIRCGEKRMRRAIFDLVQAKEKYKLEGSIKLIDVLPLGDYSIVDQIISLASEEERTVYKQKILKTMEIIEEVYNTKFVPLDLNRLAKKLFIAIWRMKNGKYVTMRNETVKGLKSLDSYRKIELIANKIRKSFNIELTECECCYLHGIIISSITCEENKTLSSIDNCKEVCRHIALEIEKAVYEHYVIKNRDIFQNELIVYLSSMANKISFELDFYNPFEESIQEKFSDIFEIATKAVPIVKEEFDYVVPKGVVSYLTLLIATALERSKTKIKTLFIYNYNYQDVELLVEVIKNNLAQIEMVGVHPIYDLQGLDISNADLVFTNSPLDFYTNKRVIILPTIINTEDILRIQKEVIEIYEEVNSKLIKK